MRHSRVRLGLTEVVDRFHWHNVSYLLDSLIVTPARLRKAIEVGSYDIIRQMAAAASTVPGTQETYDRLNLLITARSGTTRIPFVTFPEAELAKAKRRAAHWMKLNGKIPSAC